MKVISKAEAISLGLTHYFTGVPCKNGGVTRRKVKGSKCECCGCKAVKAKANQKHYEQNRDDYLRRAKAQVEANPEHFKLYKRQWAVANAEALKSKRSEYYEANKDFVLSQNRKYRTLFSDKVKEADREKYMRNRDRYLAGFKAYRAENKARIRAVNREHYLANRPAYYEAVRRRHAAKMQAIPAWYGELDEFVMVEAFDLCRERQAATGMAWHVDHMIPLQAVEACGLHCADNVQVIPASVNSAKRNRLEHTEPFEWLSAA